METETVKVGVLFSQTGKMAVTEMAHINGVLLAIEEVNTSGGILGRAIEPILMNPDGDDRNYAKMATDLLVNYGAKTIFGCCLSTSRKAVLPLIERFDGVLFYPSVYEGFEYSPNVIYGGATPNQTVPPLLDFVFQNHGRRIALIGSDTLYAREINRVVKEFLDESDGEVVVETYLPFSPSEGEITAAIAQCRAQDTDAILSTVVGEDSVSFYRLYGKSDPRAKGIPIASLTTMETELLKVPPEARGGHLSVAAYFNAAETPQNTAFKQAFGKKYGDDVVPSVYSEVGYALVHFYANAVRMSGKTDTMSVLQALSGAVFKAPGGDLFIDVETNHLTLRPHIGRSRTDGTFEIVWNSPKAAAPDPYLVAYDRSVTSRGLV
ncbi:N-acetylmuramoyl-L-alanine amidase AmiC [Actibacterium mucosum KCTC 23349]|uniref:N-acetylmuramoyl-L-alanine amidase AmiC n=1 Tax=Actibacterium mucosum KCTC 23349 TaxID=1454373 RepID=A0A037ZDY4_9RHOB|nr:transporter substrate-binding domain-containing protein [Actibacterium mucosum]KAJ54704.1 N-acetylmuramoyl-L-alanine amidase AmiC [Actibacterium mucosum KCTC 23349]